MHQLLRRMLPRNFQPTVNPVIRLQPGLRLPLIMILSISGFIAVNIKEGGHCAVNVTQHQQTLLFSVA